VKSNKVRKLLVEELQKMPIVSVACRRVGIARASFYRWKKTDKKLAEQIKEATQEGNLLINDMAVSLLVSKIKGGDVATAKYWLRYHDPTYSDRIIQIKKPPEEENKELSPEDMALIDRVLELEFGKKRHKKPENIKTIRINKELAYNVVPSH